MIRVTIDIVPGGDEAEKHTVRVIEIGNVTKHEDFGDPVHTYEAREVSAAWVLDDRAKSKRCTTVRNAGPTELLPAQQFAHNRSDGLEACVRRAIVALYGGER